MPAPRPCRPPKSSGPCSQRPSTRTRPASRWARRWRTSTTWSGRAWSRWPDGRASLTGSGEAASGAAEHRPENRGPWPGTSAGRPAPARCRRPRRRRGTTPRRRSRARCRSSGDLRRARRAAARARGPCRAPARGGRCPSRSTANSSPPQRATRIRGPDHAHQTLGAITSIRSPTSWPCRSLIDLKSSRSMNRRAPRPLLRRLRAIACPAAPRAASGWRGRSAGRGSRGRRAAACLSSSTASCCSSATTSSRLKSRRARIGHHGACDAALRPRSARAPPARPGAAACRPTSALRLPISGEPMARNTMPGRSAASVSSAGPSEATVLRLARPEAGVPQQVGTRPVQLPLGADHQHREALARASPRRMPPTSAEPRSPNPSSCRCPSEISRDNKENAILAQTAKFREEH